MRKPRRPRLSGERRRLSPFVVTGMGGDVRPRDQRDLMERPFFSLAETKRLTPILYLRYQVAFAENLEIDDANVQQVADAADPEAPNDASLDEPKSFLDQLVPAAEDGGTDVPSTIAEGAGRSRPHSEPRQSAALPTELQA